MPKLTELREGDLICDLDDDDHFMMWVGGHLPLVENVETDIYGGVFMHSASKITKRSQKMQNTSGGNSSDSEGELDGFEVFRCDKPAIATQAAAFAREWATGTDSTYFQEAKQKGEFFKLKIPFNQSRLTHERTQAHDEWDARSLFRAVRVLARHDSGIPLSVKGWTCSSFATYCFQAAALRVLYKDSVITPYQLETISRDGGKTFLSIKSDIDLIKVAFSEPAEIIRKLIPKGLLIDGKAIDATNLKETLRQSDSQFTSLGNITV